MPLCEEHGQVYPEGGKCRVCDGKSLAHRDPDEVLASTVNIGEIGKSVAGAHKRVDSVRERVSALEVVVSDQQALINRLLEQKN